MEETEYQEPNAYYDSSEKHTLQVPQGLKYLLMKQTLEKALKAFSTGKQSKADFSCLQIYIKLVNIKYK